MKRILVPIDFSAATRRVVDLASQLAKSLGAEIHLIHVRELVPVVPPGAAGYGAAGMAELMPISTLPIGQPIPETIIPDESETEKLTEWQREFERDGVRVTAHRAVGDVVNEVLRVAAETNPD